MDLRVYYQKIRDIESKIAHEFPVVKSLETSDGGKPGILTEVPRRIAAKLVDVHPDGYCQRLCDGILRARYREGFDRAVMMEPGTVYELEIDMWNTSQVFKPGHRIRLEVTSSAFPKYDRNLNSGEDIGSGTTMVTAENRVLHDPAHPSRLVLPVIPATGE